MTTSDAEKGKLVLDAFRAAALDLVADFQDRELNPDDIETGLAYANLEGWIEYGPNQSAILTQDGRSQLT